MKSLAVKNGESLIEIKKSSITTSKDEDQNEE